MKNHKLVKVKDMLRIMEHLQGRYRGSMHKPDFTCTCTDCLTDKANGCKNPQRCALEARKRLDQITDKLNPERLPNQDHLMKSTQHEGRTP